VPEPVDFDLKAAGYLGLAGERAGVSAAAAADRYHQIRA
jgi:hypothetical protein